MPALVTGGSGFIGGYLVRELVAGGMPVRCLVRSEEAANRVRSLGAEVVYGDVTAPQSLEGIADGITQVFHLAAVGQVASVSEEAYRRFQAVNVEGTRNLIAACAGAGVQHLVHFSSVTAMGQPSQPIMDEETSCNPVSPYERSKWESEQAAFSAGSRYHVPVTIVRPCMVYGVGGGGEFLKFCQLMKKGIFPRVSRGPEWVALVHVRDVVAGAMAAADKGRPGEAYLLAGPTSSEMHELRRLILESLGLRRLYLYVPLPLAVLGAGLLEVVSGLLGRPPVVSRANIVATAHGRVYDVSKAQRDLGYEPGVPVQEGVAETVAWYVKEGLL